MEPVIRNYRSVYQPGGAAARLISLDDHPTTCTMTYSVIEPGKTSSHHIHPWEHEVYILEGSGVLVCDGKEYPIREGDAMLIPGNVDHYTLNNRSSGVIRRIEVNPLLASQSGGARNQGGQGTGQPPVIRNYRDLDMQAWGTCSSAAKMACPPMSCCTTGPWPPVRSATPTPAGTPIGGNMRSMYCRGRGPWCARGRAILSRKGTESWCPPMCATSGGTRPRHRCYG